MQEGPQLQPNERRHDALPGAEQFQPVRALNELKGVKGVKGLFAPLDALPVNGQRFGRRILRHDFHHAFGILSVERLGAALVTPPFLGFIVFIVVVEVVAVHFQHAGGRVVGAAGPEVFVPLAHVAVRQSRRFAEQLVHNFVQFVHVFGKGFAAGQMARAQRVVFEIGLQIGAAVLAGQDVLQPEYECPVAALVRVAGVHRIIEAHRVQKVPHGRTPHGGQKPVARHEIGFSKYWFFPGAGGFHCVLFHWTLFHLTLFHLIIIFKLLKYNKKCSNSNR